MATLERIPIISAADLPECPDCGGAWCPVHDLHYSDCPCLGLHNAEDEGYEVVVEAGRLYAVRTRT